MILLDLFRFLFGLCLVANLMSCVAVRRSGGLECCGCGDGSV